MWWSKKKEGRTEEEFVQQERLFEAKLLALREEFEVETKSLELDKLDLERTLAFCQANEQKLNGQVTDLHKKLLDAKSVSFPSKKFNIKKAVELLTKDLSAKTLATFLHQLVEALGKSHVETLLKYCTTKLEQLNLKENGKEI